MDNDATPIVQPSTKRIPLLLKIYAVALIVLSLITLPASVLMGLYLPTLAESNSALQGTSMAIGIVEVVLSAISSVGGIVLGIALLRDRRRHAREALEVLIALYVGYLICDIMVVGIRATNLSSVVHLVFLIALMAYIDPSLSEERALQRKLHELETEQRADDGTLGRDPSGKGYIELDFFNLFWIFVVCCVLGLAIEVVYHMVVVDPGVYQDRAGMLYGPFSPIYGIGAVLMTIALNRFHKANVVVIFLVSAVIGGAFEYAVSWFMQFAFGITAWDYTGTFLSIDGRTNGMFMAMWGVLGCLWVKLLLPRMLRLVNLIPWKWRYGLTAVCAALMFVNGAMTLMSLDCWYQRTAGLAPTNAVEQFCAEHYDDEFMEERFQSMSINPDNATRAK